MAHAASVLLQTPKRVILPSASRNHAPHLCYLTMPGLEADDQTKEEMLKAALWYSTGQTVDSISLTEDLNATVSSVGHNLTLRHMMVDDHVLRHLITYTLCWSRRTSLED